LAAAGLVVLAALAILQPAGDGPERAGAAVSDPADLSLTISDSPDPVLTGAVLTYTIKVHNAGPDPATNTVVTDGLPGGVSFVSATASGGSCSKTGGKQVCDLGTVTTTVDRTVTIKTTVKKKTGEISNSASVASDVTDPNPSNNLDTELTTIAKPPAPATCAGQPVTILGTAGPDRLVGTAGNDVISALEGDDTIYGFQGGDLICGGPGTDVIRGGAGNDLVLGGRGSDFIRGRLLAGGHGFDRCRGGPGRDRLRDCER
jgi:uncharacterized repeat protein (TIGR01451 family)